MIYKVLYFLITLSIFELCHGDGEAAVTTTSKTQHQESKPEERVGAHKELHNDLDKDPAFWKVWNFWKWGRSMFKKVLNTSSEMRKTKSASAGTLRHRLHEDRPRRKLKNKIKFLFKVHQYEV